MPDAALPEGLQGSCDARFVAVAELLARQIATGAHHGAAVSAFFEGEPVVDIWGGKRGPVIGQDFPDGPDRPWESDTIAISYSTTKGVAATALHIAMERNGVDYDQRVAEIWPAFAAKGKDVVTVRHILCHEAGIPQIHDVVAGPEDLADWDAMTARLAALEPLWEPGTANGYHAVNFGYLVGELVRRIDGRPLAQFLAEEVAGPLGLDGLYVATPPSEVSRVAPIISPQVADGAAQLSALLGPDHLLLRALSPPGDVNAYLNSVEGLSMVSPAFTGTFTARSLAKMYACLAEGGTLDGVTLLSPERVAQIAVVQNKRPDLVIVVPAHWRLGYMGGGSSWSPLSTDRAAFGHNGLNGSFGYADPSCRLSMALVLDKVDLDLLGSERSRLMAQAGVDCAYAAL